MNTLTTYTVCLLLVAGSSQLARAGQASGISQAGASGGGSPASLIFSDGFETEAVFPDLTAVHAGVDDASLTPEHPFTVSAQVRNLGNGESDPTTLRFFLSADPVISTDDTLLGSRSIAALAAAEDSAVASLQTTAPADTGSYYLGACVDQVAGETETGNQCTATAVSITVLADTDNDRLPDIVETNTGIYISPDDTGTDPNDSDTDNDNIRDGDEVVGTLDGLDLPAMGTNPLRIDLLFEYDWFDDNLDAGACAPHSHRPSAGAIARLITAFANSPVSNPNGVSGVNVINDYGQGGVFTGGNLINDPDGVLGGGFNAEFQAHKAANFATNRHGYFHYVLMPHRYNTSSGSSGLAELPGDDMIVSLQCYLSDRNVANTIMHEVGHNLMLRHGGSVNCNWKPNYNSVMNYRYQFPGIDTDCTVPGNGLLSYSVGDRNDLDETDLDEFAGICDGVAIDWNNNSTVESSVAFDVNTYPDDEGDIAQIGNCGTTLSSPLRDHDDWGNLRWDGIADGDLQRVPTFTKEIIAEQPVPEEFQH